MYCKYCGAENPDGVDFCEKCEKPLTAAGEKKEAAGERVGTLIEKAFFERNKFISLILCFFLGWAGAHRFYECKFITAIIWLFTGGLFGIGVIVDFIILLMKPTKYNPLDNEKFVRRKKN